MYEALRIVRDAAIAFRPTWVAFTPWTTLDDYLEILDFVETEGLIDHVDPVQYTIRLLVPPRSALLERPAIRPFLGPLDQASFSYRWTHADPRMDRLHESVCPMVEEATRAEEDPALTFVRVRELAETMAGPARGESHRLEPLSGRRRPPRLTEPWFLSRAHRGPVRPSAAGDSGRVVRPRRTERRSDDGTLQAVVRGN